MKKHVPAFLFSLLLHLAVFGWAFYPYQAQRTKPATEKIKLNLAMLVMQEKAPAIMKRPPEKVVKKAVKKTAYKKRTPKKQISRPKKVNKKPPEQPVAAKKVIKTARPKKVVRNKKVVKTLVQPQQQQKSVAVLPKKTLSGPLKTVTEKPPQKEKSASILAARLAEKQQRLKKIQLAEQLFKQKLGQIIQKVKFYPLKARRRGMEGEVHVLFTLLADGQIRDIRIRKKSGSRVLDKAAIKTIKKISGRIRLPSTLKRNRWTLLVPIYYRLS